MPGGDGTGPLGMGSMTGRAAGYCAGNDVAGYANAIPGGFGGRVRGMGFGRGRGFGRGFGRGLGWIGLLAAGGLLARHLFASGGPAAVTDEKTLLTEQAKAMEGALADIQRRLSELDRGEK